MYPFCYLLQGNLIGRAVIEYCDGGPPVGESSSLPDVTIIIYFIWFVINITTPR